MEFSCKKDHYHQPNVREPGNFLLIAEMEKWCRRLFSKEVLSNNSAPNHKIFTIIIMGVLFFFRSDG